MAQHNESRFLHNVFFALLALGLGGSVARGEEEKAPAPRRLNKLWFFGGGDLGFNTALSSVTGEENKSGLGLDVKGMLSIYQPEWIYEVGLGLAYKRISGTRASGLEATLSMTSAFLELGARYRLTNSWQLGPFLAGHVGGDLSHRPTIAPLLAGEPSKGFILMTGLQLFYETPHPRLPVRLGGRLFTDLTVPNRQVFGAEFSVQFGFSLSPSPVDPVVGPSVDISLIRAFFKTDSWQLSERSEMILNDMGRLMYAYRSEYERIEIEGHTDKVGTAEYNQELSQKRADSVGSIFIAKGVRRERVHTHGYGFNRPLVTTGPLDQRKNRRVVLRLFGVQPGAKLPAKIRELMDSTRAEPGEPGAEHE